MKMDVFHKHINELYAEIENCILLIKLMKEYHW